MFHSISENPPHRVGKIFCDLSYFGKSTTFAPGREDWNLKKISHTHEKFNVSSLLLKRYILYFSNMSHNQRNRKTSS